MAGKAAVQNAAHVGRVLGLLGIAVINSLSFVYFQMGMGIADGTYQLFFYAVTGTFIALTVVGVAFSVVTAFRFLGGRKCLWVVGWIHGAPRALGGNRRSSTPLSKPAPQRMPRSDRTRHRRHAVHTIESYPSLLDCHASRPGIAWTSDSRFHR